MTTAVPLTTRHLPRLDPAHSRATNQCYSRAPRSHERWHFLFEYADDAADAWCVFLTLCRGDGAWDVALTLSHYARHWPWWEHDGEVRCLAFAAAHAPLLACLAETLGGPLSVDRVVHSVDSATTDPQRLQIGFLMRDPCGSLRWRGTLACAPQCLAEDGEMDLPKRRYDWRHLRARLVIELAALTVSAKDFATLRTGSVVRLDGTRWRDERELDLRAGRHRISVAQKAHRLHVQAID